MDDCTTIGELDVIEYLLTNLSYCTSSDVVARASEAARFITNHGLSPETTLLVGLAEGDKTCGSTGIVRAIEVSLPSSWNGSVHTSFVSAFRKREGKPNLVLIDDFVGTGDKMSKKINSLRQNPKTKDYNIYVISFAGMVEGVEKIRSLVSDSYIGLSLGKLFTSNMSDPELSDVLAKMKNLEDKLFNDPESEYRLGYKASEAAFYLEAANIPNNTFPILWWEKYNDGSVRESLFPRR